MVLETKENEEDFFLLLTKIYENTGYDFREYKDVTLKRRLSYRLQATGTNTYRDYIEYLEHHPQEYSVLLSTLTINVSKFFRDKEAWNIVREKILPDLLDRNASVGTLSIWSVACARGEEPYSLAILLHEILEGKEKKFRINIYGTDIDEASLLQARQGVYNENELEEVEPEMREKYFEKLEKNKYRVKEFIRNRVKFLRHSIIDGEEFGGFDLIACRNLLIYFNRPLQEKIYLRLFNALKPGGYLWLGRAEMPVGEASRLFKVVYYRERVYRK